MSKINCPLMQGVIDDGICYDIHMVVDGMAPARTVPEKVLKVEDFKKICIECPNHRTD